MKKIVTVYAESWYYYSSSMYEMLSVIGNCHGWAHVIPKFQPTKDLVFLNKFSVCHLKYHVEM